MSGFHFGCEVAGRSSRRNAILQPHSNIALGHGGGASSTRPSAVSLGNPYIGVEKLCPLRVLDILLVMF